MVGGGAYTTILVVLTRDGIPKRTKNAHMRIVIFNEMVVIPEGIITGDIKKLELQDVSKGAKRSKYQVVYYPSGILDITRMPLRYPVLNGFPSFPQIKVTTIRPEKKTIHNAK